MSDDSTMRRTGRHRKTLCVFVVVASLSDRPRDAWMV